MDIVDIKAKLVAEYEANCRVHGWIKKTALEIGISDQVLSGILNDKFRGELRTWELIEKYLERAA